MTWAWPGGSPLGRDTRLYCLAWAWPSSPRTMQLSGGAKPLPHSNWYHPLPGSQPGWDTQLPPQTPSCSPPTSAGSGMGRDQPDWAASTRPQHFPHQLPNWFCLPGASGSIWGSWPPWFPVTGNPKGGCPPSANAIIYSPSATHLQRSPLPLHLKHKSAVNPQPPHPTPVFLSPASDRLGGGTMVVGFCIRICCLEHKRLYLLLDLPGD